MDYVTSASNTPALDTERLLLRPLVEADLEDLHRISNDPLVRRYLWDDEPVSKDTIERVIAQSARMFSEEGLGLFGIRLRGGEELLGFCGFARWEGMEEVELMYELLPELWERGLTTEARREHACATPSKRLACSALSPGLIRPTPPSCALSRSSG